MADLVKSVRSSFFLLAIRFVKGYCQRILQLPLIFFFVVPIVVIAAGFQNNGVKFVSENMFRLLFIGHISREGNLQVSSVNELAGAVAVWLFILQIAAMLFETIGKMTGRQIVSGGTTRLILTLLWLAAYLALLASPHTGSAPTFAMIFGLFYLAGLGVLSVYQLIGRIIVSRSVE